MGSGNAKSVQVAPAPVQKDIMKMAPDGVTSGHSGRYKTVASTTGGLLARDGGGCS